MTTENLIDLFTKGLHNGRNFKADTRPIVGRNMEFSYVVGVPFNGMTRLGTISLICELTEVDYYENNVERLPFGMYYYIKYDTNIDSFKPFKFIITPEEFSRLIKMFRNFERTEFRQRAEVKAGDFKVRMEQLEKEYQIEVTANTRQVITEKTTKHDINKYG